MLLTMIKLYKQIFLFILVSGLLLLGIFITPVHAFNGENIWKDNSWIRYRVMGERTLTNNSDTQDQGSTIISNSHYESQLTIRYLGEDHGELMFQASMDNLTSFLWFTNNTKITINNRTGLLDSNQFSGIFTNPAFFNKISTESLISDFVISFDQQGSKRVFVPTFHGKASIDLSDLPTIPTYQFSLNDSMHDYYQVSRFSGALVTAHGSSEYTNAITNIEYDLDYRIILDNYSDKSLFLWGISFSSLSPVDKGLLVLGGIISLVLVSNYLLIKSRKTNTQ